MHGQPPTDVGFDGRKDLEEKSPDHLGWFSEEIGMRGEQLGNFPQAFSHLSLISAAFQIDRQLKKGDKSHK